MKEQSIRLVMTLSRLVIGLTFIFSGFVKVIDPIGTGLIMGEYFKMVGLSPGFLSQFSGVSTAVLELLLGLAVLIGFRIKISSKAVFAFMLFFTLLTLYLAIFNPITHCGCFGEAIVLTHWQSFVKNLVLLLFAYLLYRFRDRYGNIAPALVEWGVLVILALSIYGLSVHSYKHLPMTDFMNYKVDTNLDVDKNNVSAPVFETTFIYSKAGKNYEFTIDNLPDSTYTFVDSKTIQVGGSTDSSGDFAVTDRSGEYVTERFVSSDRPIFIATIPNIEKVRGRAADRIRDLSDTLHIRGVKLALLTGSAWDKVDEAAERLGLSDIDIYYADYKMLLSMNRSSVGVVYLSDGHIISKWAWRDTPAEDIDAILKEDPELLAVKSRIGERLSLQFSLLILVLGSFVCRYIFKKLFYSGKRDSSLSSEVAGVGTVSESVDVRSDIQTPDIDETITESSDTSYSAIVEQNKDISRLTTLGLKVVAKWYAEPSSPEEVKAVLADDRVCGSRVLLIGSGSNLLFSREFYDGLVIHPAMKDIAIASDNDEYIFLRVGAGVVWDELVEYCVDRGWGGLENLSGIPGCVGASPVQNVGAYGSEAKDSIDSVEFVYIETGEYGKLDNSECKFGYRDSIFKNELKSKVVVTYVIFRLSKYPVVNSSYADLSEALSALAEPSIYDVREAVIAVRSAKLPDPAEVGNAGSFFKNPIVEESVASKLREEYPGIKIYPAPKGYAKLPAAWLIDQCGFKGVRKGNVGVHDKQALVLITYPGATGEELIAFAEEIRNTVLDKFGVTIEPEVQFV